MIALPPEQQTPHLRRVGSNAAPVPCTVETLRELLDYDPETGKLTWKPRGPERFKRLRDVLRFNQRFAGREALSCPRDNGYLAGGLLNRQVFAHRVAFALHHGRWPEGEVLHRDGDRGNNRGDNLVEATASAAQHIQSQGLRSDSTSGAVGVSYRPLLGRWQAHIRIAGRQHSLGYFDTRDEAIAARAFAEERFGVTHSRTAHRSA